MRDIDKRLDEELGLLKNWYLMVLKNEEPNEYSNPDGVKQSIKQLIVDEFEKMIGEPEYRETFDMGLSSWSTDDIKAFGKNELKNELRQKLNQLFDKEK